MSYVTYMVGKYYGWTAKHHTNHIKSRSFVIIFCLEHDPPFVMVEYLTESMTNLLVLKKAVTHEACIPVEV